MAERRKLKVRNWREADERLARGQLRVRRVFDAGEGGFESGFRFAQYNYLQPGEANESHIHDDIEKVYYVIQGQCLVRCGDQESIAGPGDFFFLPVLVEHSVTNVGKDEVQMVVFASKVPDAG
jgi:mannose-6-phosphate isomerase-like protein (cupin superfamily)